MVECRVPFTSHCDLDLLASFSNNSVWSTCLFYSINTCRVPRTMFEQLPRDQANVNAWKKKVWSLNAIFLHGNSLREAAWRCIHPCSNHEIRVLFEHGFYLTKPKLDPDLFAWRCTGKRCGIVWSFRRCFCSRKRWVRLWRWSDVMTFESLTLRPFLFWEIQSKKRDILMFKRRFQCDLGWNQVKYAWITVTHVCFIALTLAGSLGQCLTTRPNGLVFKQLHRDPASVNAWKNRCDPCSIPPFLNVCG